jgi:chromosome segregation ATPase
MSNDEKLDLILAKLDEHSQKFDKMDQRFDGIDHRLDCMNQRLDDHQLMLSALIHGQEELKANLDGFKIEVAKQFQSVKEDHKNIENTVELLESRVWTTEKDVHRLKKMVGIE